MIKNVREIFGNQFDVEYIYKVIERKNFVLEDVIDYLMEYKAKEEEKKKKKVDTPAPKPKQPEPKKPQQIPMPKVETKHQEKAKDQLSELSSSNKPVQNFLEVNRKSSRRISKDDFKELSLDRKTWNITYPIINYPAFDNKPRGVSQIKADD